MAGRHLWALGRAATLVIAASTAAAGWCPAMAHASTDPGCADVALVFARGTNETPGVGAVGDALTTELTARLGTRTLQVHPVDYPASLDFGRAADGVLDARGAVEHIAASCPHTAIVVGGYSQGAAVAGYLTADAVPTGYDAPDGLTAPMDPSVARHVSAVTLFGTPSPTILGLLDRDAPPLVIGTSFAAKTVQYCTDGDPICAPGGMDRAAHSAYKTNDMPGEAANYVIAKLTTNSAPPPSLPTAALTGAITTGPG